RSVADSPRAHRARDRRPGRRLDDAGRVAAPPVPRDPAQAAGSAPLARRALRGNHGRPRGIAQVSEAQGKETPMAVRRLNHAVLYVKGLERAVDCYQATVGLEVRMQISGQAAFLRAPGSANDHDLGLFEIGAGRAPDRPEHPGLYHLAWEVGTLADLADTREKLVQAGALVGESDHRVSKSLYAKDPSGIEFEGMWRGPPPDPGAAHAARA